MKTINLILLLFIGTTLFSQSYTVVKENCEPSVCGVEEFIVYEDSITFEGNAYLIDNDTFLEVGYQITFHNNGDLQKFDYIIYEPVTGMYVSMREDKLVYYTLNFERL